MQLPKRASFHPSYQTVQFAWDSTSLTRYMECPTAYAYNIVLGYRAKGSSIHLEFGSIVHKGLEWYWKNRAVGFDHHLAQLHMVKKILTTYHSFRTSDTAKNLWTALRSCVWHTEHNKNEQDKTLMLNGTPAIELPFKYDLGISTMGLDIIYCGHIDRAVIDVTDSVWVKDYKTTKNALDTRYFANYRPSTQLPGYLVAAHIVLEQDIAGVIVDGIQVGVNFSRFQKGAIFLGESERDEWMKDTQWWINQATQIIHAATTENGLDLQRIPRNTQSCFGCVYRQVCSLPPSLRLGHLASFYEQKFWDPALRKEAE